MKAALVIIIFYAVISVEPTTDFSLSLKALKHKNSVPYRLCLVVSYFLFEFSHTLLKYNFTLFCVTLDH